MDFLIHHMLRASAQRCPEKEALVDREERLSFESVDQKVSALAHALSEVGVRRGDRVGVYLDMSVPQVLSMFAISRAGAVFVPINSLLYPEQVGHIAKDCGMKALITSHEKLPLLEPIWRQIPSVEFVIGSGHDPGERGGLPTYSLDQFIDAGGSRCVSDDSIEKDLAAILYTSGSTGKPKGVMLSHAQVIAGASIVSTYLNITSLDRILTALPFSFDAGLNQLMTAFQQGGTAILMRFVFAREIVQRLAEENVTGMGGVPTLWSLMAQPSSTLQKTHLPSLRYITNTGGRMPQTVLNALRNALGTTKIFLMYGLTEAFRSTYLPPSELDRRPTSMGKAIPNTEILVINEHGQPCKPGEVGELIHRGPTVSMGYWGRPDLTEQVLRPHPFLPRELGDTERVCYSGDLVKTDEQGFLYFVGRRDNMIKSSGFRISPTEVEEVLYQSGKLREAAVIGIPDEILGHVIKAYVVPKDGEMIAEETLLVHCAERMPRYMVPKAVTIMDSLPKTSSGKFDYPELRRREELQDHHQ